MTALEVQRTLVKSPPELWNELSDIAVLTRLLDEGFGEVTIVRTTPERHVQWRSGETSGEIELEPSGWGTTVRLTAEVGASIRPQDAEATLRRVLDEVGAAHRRPFSRG